MRLERAGLGLVLLVYLALAAGYAWNTPPWNNPDEPAHYNYVVEIADRGRLPELKPGDWDAALLEKAAAERFHPRFDASMIRYEAHQPPLYYLLGVPVYELTSRASLRVQVLALRGVSIALGLVLGYLIFRLAAEVFPTRPSLWAGAAGLALLIPMQTALSASINNDLLAEVLATGTLLFLVHTRAAPSPRGAILLGLLCGAILLTKLTVYVFAVIAVACLVLRCLVPDRAEGGTDALRNLILTTCTTIAVSGWWFIRNGLTYGWNDLLANTRHAEVVVGQPQWAHYGADAWVYFIVTLFHSFFAQFGWMTVVADDLTYGLFGAFVLLAIAGLMLRPFDADELHLPADISNGIEPAPNEVRAEQPSPLPYGASPVSAQALTVTAARLESPSASGARTTGAALIFTAAIIGVIGQLLYYNLSFIQAQGRYLFPAIGPIAILLAVGWAQVSDGGGGFRSTLGRLVIALWAALAMAAAIGGVADWDVGPRAIGTFAGLALLLVTLCLRVTPKAVDPLTLGLGVLGFGALNLVCLTRYVIPYYFG